MITKNILSNKFLRSVFIITYITNTEEYNIDNTKTRAKNNNKNNKSLRGNALSILLSFKTICKP